MKTSSYFHYNSALDNRYLGDFFIKSWTRVILSKPCKLWLTKIVIPKWAEIVLVWEDSHWDNRKKVILQINWERIEISTNILLDSELFREIIKISSWKYKISEVSDIICNQIKSWLEKKKEKEKKKEEKHHHKDENKHHIWKKEKWMLKEIFKRLWFLKK